jgi:hypothetical protein
MDVGPGWSVSGGTWTIQSNALAAPGTFDSCFSNSSHADISAAVDITTGSVTTQFMELLFRYTDTQNFWVAAISGTGFSIYEVAANVTTQRATTTIPALTTNTTYHVAVTAVGASITATLNGGSTISYGSAATGLSATKHGVRDGASASYDNFLVTSTGAGSPISTEPQGKRLCVGNNFDAVLKVTSAPSGGSPNLTVYFQSSSDDGETWNDFVCASVSSAGTTIIPVSTIAAGSTSPAVIKDGSLAANTVVQGPVGNWMRIKYSSTGGTSGFFTFQAFIYPCAY